MNRKNNSREINKSSDKTTVYVAIIGLFGTIVVALISFLNTRTEILLPVSLTQTAQALNPLELLANTKQITTQLPPFTATPYPTYTQLVAPTVVIPTSTPVTKLFADDFDTGINPTWAYMEGANFGMTNGQLSSTGLFNAYVGNNNWTNYVVEFDVNNLQWSSYNFIIMIRRQGDLDYMGLQFKTINYCRLKWVKVTNGNEKEIVNSETHVSNPPGECYGRSYKIEVTGNTYKTFGNGQLLLIFTDDTFANGGVGLLSTSTHKDFVFSIDNFQIKSLP